MRKTDRSGPGAAMGVACLALFLIAAAPDSPVPPGEIQAIVLGLVAPSGTFGLSKHLLSIPGVERVSFDLRHGLARLELRPGAAVTDEQIREAIRASSYTPGEIRRPATPSGR